MNDPTETPNASQSPRRPTASRTNHPESGSISASRTEQMTRHALRWIHGASPNHPRHPTIPHLADPRRSEPRLSDLRLSDRRWLDQAFAAELQPTPPLGTLMFRINGPFASEPTEPVPHQPGGLLAMALSHLDPRTRHIVTALHLLDQPLTPESLASRHRMTPHQIQTIDARAFPAIQRWMRLYVADQRNAARLSQLTKSESRNELVT